MIEDLEFRTMLSSWYVAPYGVNTNPGTLQQPFATIQQAADVANAGDTVYIRGGTYHETVTPVNSGTAGDPITFEPYNNETVTIDGADPVTGWTRYQGDIYTAPQPWDLGEGNNQVFVDGIMVNEARFPNSSLNVSTPTWARASSIKASVNTSGGISTAVLYDAALSQPAGTWVGAICHIAAGQQWVDQAAIITASSPGSITIAYYQETSYQVPTSGNEFYIVGARVALDSPGEWYRSTTTGQLSLWDPAGDSPANHTIEAKARLYAFDLSGLTNIDVKGINLFACTINTSAASSNILLDHLTATYVSQSIGITADTLDPWGAQYHPHTTGIILNGTNNILQNSIIAYSSGDGVFVGGSNNTVQNCTIHDVDYEAGDEAGITTLGSNEQILNNTVYNTGRSGIVIRFTTDSQIMHNIVHNVGLQMTDLGAIYTWGTNGEGTEIGYNICYNIHTGGYGAGGIYLDNFSQNYVVDHNVVWNADCAFKMNPPCTDNLVVNNTFIGSQYSLASSGNEVMTGSTLENNIFVGKAMLGPGLSQSHNLFSPATPQFVNTAASNYQLLSTASAINGGAIVSPYTFGYLGSAPDIGAYEFGVLPFTTGAALTPYVGTPTAKSAGQDIQAAGYYFTPQSYVAQWATANSGDGLAFTKQWAWAEYKSINFGKGVTELMAQVSRLPATAERIQIRLDSTTGPVVATLTLPAGKQPSSVAQTLTAKISGLSGVHNIYLMLIDPASGGELDGFSFS